VVLQIGRQQLAHQGAVYLQAAGKQEDATERYERWQIKEVDGLALAFEAGRPIVEDVRRRHPVGEAKAEIQVRSPVAAALGKRADHGAGNDAIVRPRHGDDAVSHLVTLFDAEHAQNSRRKVSCL